MRYTKTILLVIVFLLALTNSNNLKADEKVDSLVATWNKLAEQYLSTSEMDSACKYGNCSVEMLDKKIEIGLDERRASEIKKWKAQKAKALTFLATAYGNSGQLEQSELCYNDALEIYKEFNDQQSLFQLHFSMAQTFYKITRFVSAIDYYNKALEVSITLNDPLSQALCYYFIGVNNRYLGNSYEALKYALKDLEIREKLDDKKGIASAYITIAAILVQLKDDSTAIEKLNAARKLFETIPDSSGIATVYNDLGKISLIISDTLNALKNHMQAANIRKKIKEFDGLGASYSYIGEIYGDKKDFKQALQYLNLSLITFDLVNNKDGIVNTSIKVAQIYYHMQQPDSTLAYLDIAENIAKEIMHSRGLAQVYSIRGELKLENKKYTEAKSNFQKALDISIEQKRYKDIYKIHKLLAEVYSKMWNYKSALKHQLLSSQYKDTLDKKANLSAAAQMDMEYNYKKQQLQEKLIQEKKDEINLVLLQQQKTQKTLYFAGVIMFLMVSLGLWSRLRYIRKAGNELLQRKEEAERQRMIAESEKLRATHSEKVKEQFLANMSHEIRTPMNAIKGMTDILIRNKHLPSQDKSLEVIKQSSDNLLVILNEILDLSKLEAGKMEPENIPFEPKKVIQNIFDILKLKAEEKGLKLLLEIDREIPTYICGDPTHVNQIILNLASNAIKFTDKGTVKIETFMKNMSDDQVTISYKISDTGIGITTSKLEQIFDTFTQADTDTTRKYGGTGLGLSICKRLTELNKGTINVESKLNEGSVFTVDLPFRIVKGEVEKPIEPSFEELSDLKILLAEDNEFNAMVACDVLENSISGVKVDVAENGKIAVSKIEKHDYDLVLMDIQMPELDGYDATKAIRKMEGKKGSIPIIAMTANVMKAEVDRCFEAGMNAYLSKPIELAELFRQIKKAIIMN